MGVPRTRGRLRLGQWRRWWSDCCWLTWRVRVLSRYYGLWMWFPELLKRVEVGGSPCANVSAPARVENSSCYPVKMIGAYLRRCLAACVRFFDVLCVALFRRTSSGCRSRVAYCNKATVVTMVTSSCCPSAWDFRTFWQKAFTEGGALQVRLFNRLSVPPDSL